MDADALRALAAKLMAPQQQDGSGQRRGVSSAQRPVPKSELVAQEEKRKEEQRRKQHLLLEQEHARMPQEQRQQQEYLDWRAKQQQQQQQQQQQSANQPAKQVHAGPVRIPGAQPGRKPLPGAYLTHGHVHGGGQNLPPPQAEGSGLKAQSIDMVREVQSFDNEPRFSFFALPVVLHTIVSFFRSCTRVLSSTPHFWLLLPTPRRPHIKLLKNMAECEALRRGTEKANPGSLKSQCQVKVPTAAAQTRARRKAAFV
jgi:hypothetical protein